MVRRDKVLLIRGFDPHLVEEITIAPVERVNIDHLIAAVALKYPSYWPPELLKLSFHTLEGQILEFAKALLMDDKQHIIFSEYGALIQDRGEEVRAVFGRTMELDWLYQSVKFFHKNNNQRITEIVVKDHYTIEIDGVIHVANEAINILRENPEIC